MNTGVVILVSCNLIDVSLLKETVPCVKLSLALGLVRVCRPIMAVVARLLMMWKQIQQVVLDTKFGIYVTHRPQPG